MRFLLVTIAGALLGGAAGFAADAALRVEGWWLWGICAGAVVGAVVGYTREKIEVPNQP